MFLFYSLRPALSSLITKHYVSIKFADKLHPGWALMQVQVLITPATDSATRATRLIHVHRTGFGNIRVQHG